MLQRCIDTIPSARLTIYCFIIHVICLFLSVADRRFVFTSVSQICWNIECIRSVLQARNYVGQRRRRRGNIGNARVRRHIV